MLLPRRATAKNIWPLSSSYKSMLLPVNSELYVCNTLLLSYQMRFWGKHSTGTTYIIDAFLLSLKKDKLTFAWVRGIK